MKTVKIVAGFAGSGFLLSLISGLVSGAGFGRSLLMALLFAVIFSAVGFFVQLAFDKLLEIDTSLSISDTESSQTPTDHSKNVHKVDITIEDEELPSDENAPKFVVGHGHSMLTAQDMASKSDSNPVPSAEQEMARMNAVAAAAVDSQSPRFMPEEQKNAGFTPMPLVETPTNLSGKEAKTFDEVRSAQNKALLSGHAPVENPDETLDTLPDLSALETAPQASIGGDAGEIIVNSDFAQTSSVRKEQPVQETGDAQIMAKAISTLLAKES